jgi:hypothetical protein
MHVDDVGVATLRNCINRIINAKFKRREDCNRDLIDTFGHAVDVQLCSASGLDASDCEIGRAGSSSVGVRRVECGIDE